MNGSAEVVENVGKTPLAMGYSGMGYKTQGRELAQGLGQKGRAGRRAGHRCGAQRQLPDLAQTLSLHRRRADRRRSRDSSTGSLSDEGQKIVGKEGFVPLK